MKIVGGGRNDFETAGRERKVSALTALIVELWADVPELLRSPRAVDLWLGNFTAEMRNALAVEAEINPPSSDTWSRVCRRVHERLNQR